MRPAGQMRLRWSGKWNSPEIPRVRRPCSRQPRILRFRQCHFSRLSHTAFLQHPFRQDDESRCQRCSRKKRRAFLHLWRTEQILQHQRHARRFQSVLEQRPRQGTRTGGAGCGGTPDHADTCKEYVLPHEEHRPGKRGLWTAWEGRTLLDSLHSIVWSVISEAVPSLPIWGVSISLHSTAGSRTCFLWSVLRNCGSPY